MSAWQISESKESIKINLFIFFTSVSLIRWLEVYVEICIVLRF